jgi:altronate dehydratase
MIRKVIQLDPRDNVVTALEDLNPGDGVRLESALAETAVREAIPFGHKMALCAIPAGGEVIKYGECMGVASHSIAAGTHVHVHNVNSRRART